MTAARKTRPVTKAAPVVRDIDIIYREHILDHYRHPRHFGRMANADISRREANFSCGDEIEIFVRFGPDGRAAEIKFAGRGCAVSQAAASLLTEKALGLTRQELAGLTGDDANAWLGVPVGPGRQRCATLGLKALQAGLADASGKKPKRPRKL